MISLFDFQAVFISSPEENLINRRIYDYFIDNNISIIQHDYRFGNIQFLNTYFKEFPDILYIVLLTRNSLRSKSLFLMIEELERNRKQILFLLADNEFDERIKDILLKSFVFNLSLINLNSLDECIAILGTGENHFKNGFEFYNINSIKFIPCENKQEQLIDQTTELNFEINQRDVSSDNDIKSDLTIESEIDDSPLQSSIEKENIEKENNKSNLLQLNFDKETNNSLNRNYSNSECEVDETCNNDESADNTYTENNKKDKNKISSLNSSDDLEYYNSFSINKIPQNQYDEYGNIILPVYEENEKKGKIGIIFGILAAIVLIAGGIIGYHYYIETIPFFSSFIKSKPEIEVKNFIVDFLEIADNGNKDMLYEYYSDVVYSDNLNIPITPNIVVNNISGTNQYEIRLSDNPVIILYVSELSDGNFQIISSKGFFYYDPSQIEVAKKTGIWSYDLTDAQLAERMNDRGYWEYLKSISNHSSLELIKIGESDGSEILLINQTDKIIKGNDYEVKYESYSRVGDSIEGFEYEYTSYTKPGKDIQPNGKVKYDSWGDSGGGELVKGIIYKMTLEQLNEFYSFTGNEYQEYLSFNRLKVEDELTKDLILKYFRQGMNNALSNNFSEIIEIVSSIPTDNPGGISSYDEVLWFWEGDGESDCEESGYVDAEIISIDSMEARADVKYRACGGRIISHTVSLIKERQKSFGKETLKWVIDDFDGKKQMFKNVISEAGLKFKNGLGKELMNDPESSGFMSASEKEKYLQEVDKFIKTYDKFIK